MNPKHTLVETLQKTSVLEVKTLLGLVYSWMRPNLLRAAMGLALVVIASCVTLFLPQCLRHMLSISDFSSLSTRAFNESLFAFVALFIVIIGATTTRHYLIQTLGDLVTDRLRSEAFRHCLSLDAKRFDQKKDGLLITTLNGDIDGIRAIYTGHVPTFFRNIILVMGSFAILIFSNLWLTLVMIVFVPLFALPVMVLFKHLRLRTRELDEKKIRKYAFINEHIEGFRVIQLFSQESEILKKYHAIARSVTAECYAILKLRMLFMVMTMSTIVFVVSAVLFLGRLGVQHQLITVAELVQFGIYTYIASRSINSMSENINEFLLSSEMVSRVYDLFEEQSSLTVEPQPSDPAKTTRAAKVNDAYINFNNVFFAYPSRPNDLVLQDLSFSVKRGEHIGLVGLSGSGKSSIVKLLTREYDPSHGTINIGGIFSRCVEPSEWRKQFSVITQDVVLFAGTIAENIAFSNPYASIERITQAAKSAQIHEFIMSLPNGYSTEMNVGSKSMSGGQRQRLAFARALIKEAPIFLMDEGTSAMDSENEFAMMQALKNERSHATMILVTHRLATIRNVDRIFVFENGHLIAEGNHESLQLSSPVYSNLVNLQRMA